MNIIQRHPFMTAAIIGAVLGLTGFLLATNDPAKTLMFTGIVIFALAGAAGISSLANPDV